MMRRSEFAHLNDFTLQVEINYRLGCIKPLIEDGAAAWSSLRFETTKTPAQFCMAGWRIAMSRNVA